MHLKLVRAAATTVAIGAAVALGPASAQAALAKPAPSVTGVPCSASLLAAAISGASSGDTLSLAPGCDYVLTAALPDINTDLTIVGNGATLVRSYGAPDFTILTVDSGNVTLVGVGFRNGGGGGSDGGAIYNDGGGNATVRGGSFLGNSGDYGGSSLNHTRE